MSPTTVHDHDAATIDGEARSLAAYSGKVLLIVNVASDCGLTPQYAGLEALYRRYRQQGLVVLGFPCDQFGNQEPGAEAKIAEFCSTTYGVSFPMFAKVEVNGPEAHPLFAWLREEKSGLLGAKIRWNFTKFLVGRDGRVVKRYGSTTAPDKIARDVERQLAA